MSADNRRIYEIVAGHYDALVAQSPFYSNIRSAELAVVSSLVSARELPGHVLDIGCGTGDALDAFARHRWVGHGIDFSPKMVELARGRTADFHESVTVSCGDCTDSAAWPDGPFDVVVSFSSVVNHLPDARSWEAFFRRASEVLRPGGTLVFTMDSILALDSLGWLITRFRDKASRRKVMADIRRSVKCIASGATATNEWPLTYHRSEFGLHLSYLPSRAVHHALASASLRVTDVRGVNALSALAPTIVRSSTYATQPRTKIGTMLTKLDSAISTRIRPLAANLIISCEHV